MSDVIIPAPKAVVAFGRRHASEERIRHAEEELKQLSSPKEEEDGVGSQEDDSSLSAEEKTFKKRYGDLRRHSQKIKEDAQKEIDELKQQLAAASQKQIKLPKTQEELDAWASQYPDVYDLVKTIAIQEAKQQTVGLEERMRKVDEIERNTYREKAEAELMRLHPDIEEIREQDAFHAWVEEQPDWIQKALYENDNDARAAARAIDLYKADMNISKKTRQSSDKGAATSVTTRGSKVAPNGEGTEGLMYESQVAKMSSAEFERNMEAIQTAQRTNKFVYDMSGAAR